MNDTRKYVAVSIKHTEYRWKFGMPCCLWGFHQTEDDEPRCFVGYTQYLRKAERYALGEFKRHDPTYDFSIFGEVSRTYSINRPPLSWCYVEQEG